ncbi:LppU/SCO3897 family protein [Yinghuangia seranimata]|uniref:LppU/SCO3897 family protein n=1 Tax=Yinghuangia seranimata TaxID=408067 RepID=UPI00248C7316|nr:hypothetical protein [Yinghuangia seranimata]MDI2131424.1 hypothetical protein [Yinghuangia seranimata]
MYDRPDPDGVEPTPYLPAWLDGTPPYGEQYPQPYAEPYQQQYEQQYEQQYQQPYTQPQAQPYGQSYGQPAAQPYERHRYDEAFPPEEEERPQYGGRPIGYYGDPSQELVPRQEARSAELVPTDDDEYEGRRDRRRAGRRDGRVGGVMRTILVCAVLVCVGVFGYWGWTVYEGSTPVVEEGDCIAALNGDDVKPLKCGDSDAHFLVMEIFTNSTDTGSCAQVLGATNPLVVQRDGRSDVWCVGPK